MHFFTLALVACATFGVSIADVSHLVKHYIQPNLVMQLSPAAMTKLSPKSGRSNGERVVTTIEQQELQELPTQIEYLQPGQMPYGFEVTKAKVNDIAGTKTIKMMMPSHPSPSLPPIPSVAEQPPTLPPYIKLLPPALNGRQLNTPVIQNVLPMMNESQRNPERNTTNALSVPASSMQMRAQKQERTPSRQYLIPKEQNRQDKISPNPAIHTPHNQYLTPATMPSHEQELQEQSAPSPQYLPPQQQALDMPPNRNLPPQFLTYEVLQQSQPMPPSSYYLPPLTKTLKQNPTQRETLSQFGEVENVAEAAQEAIEMFDEQLLHQPMPSPNEEAPAYNFEYLPTQLDKTQNIASSQLNLQQRAVQMAPADFVRQHKQLMLMQGDVANISPMSFTQFHVSNADPNLQIASYPVPAHLLSSDGYHYHNAGNSNELNSGDNAVGRFSARQ